MRFGAFQISLSKKDLIYAPLPGSGSICLGCTWVCNRAPGTAVLDRPGPLPYPARQRIGHIESVKIAQRKLRVFVLVFVGISMPCWAQESVSAARTALSSDHAQELDSTGRYLEAQRVYEALVAADTRELGAQSAKTLADRVALATARSKAGDSLAAEDSLRELVPIFARRWGPEHQETLACRFALARTIEEQARPAEAYREYKAILEIRERLLGSDDIETARTKHSLADTLVSLDRLDEVLRAYREAGQVFEKALGPENAETLQNRASVALVLAEQHDFDTARKELFAVLTIRERLLGPDDPTTGFTYFQIARCLGEQGLFSEALPMAQKAEKVLEASLGSGHMNTIRARSLRARIEFDIAQKLENPPANGSR